MTVPRNNEVDCADCRASPRCWQQNVSAGGGFLVRRVKPLQTGDVFFRQGAPFEAPFLVTSGCLAITELLADGSERIAAFRVPGEMVGLESWNLTAHRYGAVAIAPSTLCRLRWGNASAGARSASLLRALLAKATTQSGEVSMPWPGLPARERVRAFLADFRSRTDQPLPMTRAQIGQYLGMAEETVVRALKAIERADAA